MSQNIILNLTEWNITKVNWLRDNFSSWYTICLNERKKKFGDEACKPRSNTSSSLSGSFSIGNSPALYRIVGHGSSVRLPWQVIFHPVSCPGKIARNYTDCPRVHSAENDEKKNTHLNVVIWGQVQIVFF